MKVYLAGGILGLNDSDAKDWREGAKRALARLGIAAVDPMSRDYRGIEDENVGDIVHGDLNDIAQCQVVVANCPRPSWGTAMEIHHAYSAGKRVIAIVPSGMRVSPWLRYHSEVVASIEDAIALLEEVAK